MKRNRLAGPPRIVATSANGKELRLRFASNPVECDGLCTYVAIAPAGNVR
jgi:hypothetical protein